MKKLRIFLPLIIACAVAGGVWLGVNLNTRTQSATQQRMNFYQSDKLSVILNLIGRDYVDSVDKNALVEQLIPELLNELDPHTSYIPAKEMEAIAEQMRGDFSGIGVQFVMQHDTVMVIDVIWEGPSYKLGILPGDRIVEVEDSIIAGVKMDSDDIVSMLRGEHGTMVNIKIKRRGVEELLPFEIKRGKIPLKTVDVAYMMNNETGYVKVSRFGEKTYREFFDGVKSLKDKGANNVLIDLRGNTGGYLDIVNQMVDEFLSDGKMIVYTEGRARKRNEVHASEANAFVDLNVVVLIDEFSASASEIFAGAIQDNDRGMVVGRRSFGKGLVQEQIPFMDGSVLRLTVSRYYTPSGRCIQKTYEEGNDEYRNDIHNRIEHGEFYEKDSIALIDTVKYFTSKGRVVYGGGGIMPDVFVPVDTTGMNDFFGKLVGKNLVYRYALDYSDDNREELNQFETVETLVQKLKELNIFEAFVTYAKSQGVVAKKAEVNEAREIIETQLMAYVGRNMLGDDGFYPIIHKIDQSTQKALEVLNKDNDIFVQLLVK